MDIRKLTRALLAWARPPRTPPSPPQDRARIKRVLASKLSSHLLKDLGGEDG